jgi:hypothetical protein
MLRSWLLQALMYGNALISVLVSMDLRSSQPKYWNFVNIVLYRNIAVMVVFVLMLLVRAGFLLLF